MRFLTLGQGLSRCGGPHHYICLSIILIPLSCLRSHPAVGRSTALVIRKRSHQTVGQILCLRVPAALRKFMVYTVGWCFPWSHHQQREGFASRGPRFVCLERMEIMCLWQGSVTSALFLSPPHPYSPLEHSHFSVVFSFPGETTN